MPSDILETTVGEARGLVDRQTDDLVLRAGLKHMLSLSASVLTTVAVADEEGSVFAEMEEIIVDRFIDGLRANGYDIVKLRLDETPQA